MNDKENSLLVSGEWYELLIEECRAIVGEATFTSRWALVEGYWQLGKRIREDEVAQEYSKGNKTFVQDLGRNLGLSTSTVYYSLQVYDKYPDINRLPEGKNISWNKLITKYLPNVAPKVKGVPKIESGEVVEVLEEVQDGKCKCPRCGFVFTPNVAKAVSAIKEAVSFNKKYSSIKDITKEDIQELSDFYKVSKGFVYMQLESLKNYCESRGKQYKNYKAALKNFIIGDLKRGAEKKVIDYEKRGIDARDI